MSLEAAIKWAELGYYVFPLARRVENGKISFRPAIGDMEANATNDPEQVKYMWTSGEFKSTNKKGVTMTLAAGDYDVGHQGIGRVFLDVDHRGEGTGFASLKRLIKDISLPSTRTVKTPSGGCHLEYRLLPGFKAGNHFLGKNKGFKRDNQPYPYIDVRGSGGYVVAEGTVRHDGAYTLVKDIPVAACPLELLALLTFKERPVVDNNLGSVGEFEIIPDFIPHHSRNNLLTSYCGSWLGKGLSEQECLKNLETFWRNCEKVESAPFEWQEALGVYESIKASHAANNAQQPTITEESASVEDWVQQAKKQEVLNTWISKVKGFSATATDKVIQAISQRCSVGVTPLRDDLKEQKRIWARDQRRAAREQQSDPGISVIRYEVNGLGKAAQQAARALSASSQEDCVYRFGAHLVSVTDKIPTDLHDMAAWHNENTIKPYHIRHHKKPYSLIPELEKVAILETWSKTDGDYTRSQWDDKVVNTIIQTPYPTDKVLTGVIEFPYIDDKFKVVKRNGYDPQTGLVHRYDFSTDLDLDHVTAENAQEAYRFLRDEALADFPFETELDAAAAVSMFLNILQLHMISDGGNPGYIINAPNQADGKTTLAQHVNGCITGKRDDGFMAWSSNEEERAKVILAALIDQKKMLLYDNVPEGKQLESNVIAATMTSKKFSGRVLGVSEIKTVPMNALLVMTGNNIRPMKDFNTRMLTINLNSRMENPGSRKFSRESLSAWREQYREDVIKACLIIMKAPASKVNGVAPTRFKDWSKYVNRPIYQASGHDIGQLFIQNMRAERSEDEWGNCLMELWNYFGTENFTSKELTRAIHENKAKLKSIEEEIDEEKKRSRRGFGELITKYEVARYLGPKVDKIYDRLTMRKDTGTKGEQKNRAVWRVEELDK